MRKRSLIAIVILVISAIGLAFLAWRVWPPQQKPLESAQDRIDVSGWKTYRSGELGFEMKMPKGWNIFREESDEKPASPYGGVNYGRIVLGTTSTYNWGMNEGVRVKIAISDYEDYWDGEQPPLVLKDTVLIDGIDAKRSVFFIKKGEKQGSMNPYQAEEGFLVITPQSVREYIVDVYNSRTKRFYHFYLQSVGKSVSTSEELFNAVLANFKLL